MKLTDESNFRGDLEFAKVSRSDTLTEEERKAINKRLEEASNEESQLHDPKHSNSRLQGGKMLSGRIDPADWNLEDIPEPEVLKDGEEVKVSIISVSCAETKAGGIPYWRITLEVPEQPLVKSFSFNLYQPYEGQTAKEDFNTKYRIKQFMKAFRMDVSRPFFPEEDWIGETAWCMVNMKEDKEYGRQNQVRNWILPK